MEDYDKLDGVKGSYEAFWIWVCIFIAVITTILIGSYSEESNKSNIVPTIECTCNCKCK